MNKEELKLFIANHPSNYSIQLKRLFPETYNDVINQVGKTLGEKIYRYINGNDTGHCDVCKQPTQFISYKKGFNKTCSYKCLNSKKIVALIKKTCPICFSEFETDKRHNRVTCSKACQETYIKLDFVKDKQKINANAAIQKKYGVESVWKIPEVLKKSKETKIKKYGSSVYVNSKQTKITKLKKYGNETYNNSLKQKNTLLKKYGVDNISKMSCVPEKANQTKLEKFGNKMISHAAYEKLMNGLENGSLGISSESSKKTMLDRYGTIHVMQTVGMSARVVKTAHDNFYTSLIDGSRLHDLTIPCFTREEYVGTRGTNNEKIFYPFKCKKCGYEFSATIEDGAIPTCSICFPITSSLSEPENEIAKFIIKILPNTEIIKNTRSIIPPMELDIYIPSKNFAIEFDGMIWHSENIGKKEKKYHLIKTNLCAEKNIRLMHIFENEWVKKQDIVKRKIAYALGININNHLKKIYARNCIIQEISAKTSNEYLNTWHIQGKDNAKVRFGAYFGEKLVACMTFGKKRIALGSKNNNEKKEYEMYRFCVGNVPVIGIAGKLLSAFITKYKPDNIFTFADVRYSGVNAFYEKIGFKKIGITEPNYWYFNTKTPYEIKHRYGFRKSELSKKLLIFNNSLSEWENMKINGFDRIWDCGNLKYMWTKLV